MTKHDEFNYPSDHLSADYTPGPFVRSNAGFPDVPTDHMVSHYDPRTGRSRKFGIEDLRRLRTHHFTVAIECAGNSRKFLPYATEGVQWDNRAVSNVVWGGALLVEAIGHPPQGAVEVVFTSLDGQFARSLPVDVIKGRPVLLAHEMNFTPLAREHGAPIRVLVPGWYGVASLKWLDRVYYTNAPFEGPYQTDKYTYVAKDGSRRPVTTMLPKSIFTAIGTNNPILAHGKAWASEGVDGVEVRVAGKWHEAEVVTRTGTYGWVSWRFRVELTPGRHELACRAWSKGQTQPDEPEYNLFGYGNNAVQTAEAVVR